MFPAERPMNMQVLLRKGDLTHYVREPFSMVDQIVGPLSPAIRKKKNSLDLSMVGDACYAHRLILPQQIRNSFRDLLDRAFAIAEAGITLPWTWTPTYFIYESQIRPPNRDFEVRRSPRRTCIGNRGTIYLGVTLLTLM